MRIAETLIAARALHHLHRSSFDDGPPSRLGEVLLTEGLRWRKQETWFGERVDPEFAAKRGQ